MIKKIENFLPGEIKPHAHIMAIILSTVLTDFIHVLVTAPLATITLLLDKINHQTAHLQNHVLIAMNVFPTRTQIQFTLPLPTYH